MAKYRIDIFYSGHRLPAEISREAIIREYSTFLEPEIRKHLEVDSRALSLERGQYDADMLLKTFEGYRNLFLWLVDRDIYIEGMNFVFGCAIRMKGAVLSVYRLNSEELIRKETVHEVGHILGLGHCENDCVMRFSNSLQEAIEKPSHLCSACREKLQRMHGI